MKSMVTVVIIRIIFSKTQGTEEESSFGKVSPTSAILSLLGAMIL